MIALRWSSVVGIAPVLLTRRFSLSQMFSNMFKSGDLDGKSTTFTLFAFMKCSGGPCTMGWSTSVQQLHSSVVFQQWPALHVDSLVPIYEDNVSFMM